MGHKKRGSNTKLTISRGHETDKEIRQKILIVVEREDKFYSKLKSKKIVDEENIDNLAVIDIPKCDSITNIDVGNVYTN